MVCSHQQAKVHYNKIMRCTAAVIAHAHMNVAHVSTRRFDNRLMAAVIHVGLAACS